MATFAYLRVSTLDQETEKNKFEILKFANERDLGKVSFVEENISGRISWKKRKLAAIIENFNKGDILVTNELSRLGRDMLELMELVKLARDKGFTIYAIKDEVMSSTDSEVAMLIIAIRAWFAEQERKLISMRTKEGLQAAKASGKQIGRKKGFLQSKLDPYREEIREMLDNGIKQVRIAEKYSVTAEHLSDYIKNYKLKPKKLTKENPTL